LNHWAPIIFNCSSREELNIISDGLAADWHRLTLKAESPAPSADRLPRPPNPPTDSLTHRRRGQSRQQQQIRKKNNSKRWEAASKLQAFSNATPGAQLGRFWVSPHSATPAQLSRQLRSCTALTNS
jgi:hypothetical protein